MELDERIWRAGWAAAYSGAANLYCDDGELQDNSEAPFIDWMRDPAVLIRDKIMQRACNQIMPPNARVQPPPERPKGAEGTLPAPAGKAVGCNAPLGSNKQEK